MSPSCKRSGIIAALSLFALPLSPTRLYSQAMPATTIGVGVVQATSMVDNVSARAASEANDAIFSAAGQLRLLIEAFRNSAQNILDARLNDLNAPQRRMLEHIQTGVAALRTAADEPVEQARERIEEIRRLTSDSASAMDAPIVIRSSPSMLAPSGLNEIPVTLIGQRLTDANPRLLFGNMEATRTHLTDQEVVFTVPPSVFRSSDTTPIQYSGQLLLAVRKCRWSIRCKPAWQAYTVALVMLPIRLATVRISFDRKTNQRIYDQEPAADGGPAATPTDKLYSRRFEYSTDDLTVMSCTRQPQAPHAAGYFIDTDTLSSSIRDRRAENKWRLLDTSANGFTIELCAQPQISRLAKIIGSIAVETTWKEYRMGEVISPRESSEPQVLNWGAELQESLPADSNAPRVELEYFDGSRATLTETSVDKYVELKWDATTRHLVLTPHMPARIEGGD